MSDIEPLIVRHSAGEVSGPRVVSILSGKGGVGKSMLSANLGVYVAQSGKRVLLIDALRWGQNLHSFLGMPSPSKTVDELMGEKTESIEDLILETPYVKLKLLCGMKEMQTDTAGTKAPFLIEQVHRLPFDFVILDLGSGLSFNLFDHALWSDYAILITVPEPTAVENTYELLRGLYFRLFKTVEAKLGIEGVTEKAMLNSAELGIKTPRDLVSAIHFFNPEAGDRLKNEIGRFRVKLLLNMLCSSGEDDVAQGMVTVCRRYFGFRMEHIGSIDHDSAIPASIRRRQPLAIIHKEANANRQIEQIAHKLFSQGIKDKQD